MNGALLLDATRHPASLPRFPLPYQVRLGPVAPPFSSALRVAFGAARVVVAPLFSGYEPMVPFTLMAGPPSVSDALSERRYNQHGINPVADRTAFFAVVGYGGQQSLN